MSGRLRGPKRIFPEQDLQPGTQLSVDAASGRSMLKRCVYGFDVHAAGRGSRFPRARVLPGLSWVAVRYRVSEHRLRRTALRRLCLQTRKIERRVSNQQLREVCATHHRSVPNKSVEDLYSRSGIQCP